MRVAIDGGMLGRSGIGRYVQELMAALSALPGVAPVMVGAQGGGGSLLRLLSPAYGQRVVAGARRAGADLLHVPHFNAPWLPGMPMVVTIHDVAYLDHPEWQPSAVERFAYRAFMRRAAARARAVLTVSEFCRQRICHHLDIDPLQVHVTPLAAGTGLVSGTASGDPEGVRQRYAGGEAEVVRQRYAGREAEVVRQRYAGGAPYVLYVGNIRPHKNVPVLIAAFERARVRLGGGVKLLLVGELPPGYHEVAGRFNERVISLGQLPDAAVAVLYGAAEVFVFPSLYEGFGLSPLEAMAAGCPVICSHAASLPEVVGDAAVTFDPADVDGLALALEQVLSDGALRTDLVRRGRERAAGFSWARTAAQTAAVYRQVLAAARE